MLQPRAYDRRRLVSSRLTRNMLNGLRQGGVAEGEARQKARQAGRRCKPHTLQSRNCQIQRLDLRDMGGFASPSNGNIMYIGVLPQ